ncbi:hypothetical protein M2388_000345 [Leucobacter aridicollis]|nr:hypothetical protein [Leucobacter aridicollis]
MEWLEAALEWLNANNGATTALATVGTVVFTAVAAVAAWVSISRSRRTQRSKHRVEIAPHTFDGDWDEESGERTQIPGLMAYVWNIGIAKASLMRATGTEYRLGKLRQGGGTIVVPPEPGTVLKIPFLLHDDSPGQYLLISWLDADGAVRKLKRWYSLTVPLDHNESDRKNQRSDLGFPDPLQRLVDRPRRLAKRPPLRLWRARRKRAHELRKTLPKKGDR